MNIKKNKNVIKSRSSNTKYPLIDIKQKNQIPVRTKLEFGFSKY
jgi:hypothetical protein